MENKSEMKSPEAISEEAIRDAVGQFRSQWHANLITVEEFLQQQAIAHRDHNQLTIHLIKTEIELMRGSGKRCTRNDYEERFPGLSQDVLQNLFSLPAPPPVSVLKPLLPVRYQPIRSIGQGGIGTVWYAKDKRMQRSLAVKVLHARFEKDEAANERLKREAMLTGSLQHPGIPPIFEYGSLVSGSHYFAMKLVEGDTLDKVLPMRSQVELISIFRQIAEAVGYAHSKKVIHRDLKPQNVMVGAFGEVQIMDWGLAKRLSLQSGSVSTVASVHPESISRTDTISIRSESETDAETFSLPLSNGDLTQQGDVVGTPAYMSPEQAGGVVEGLSPATDVYAMGAMLFEILSGERWYRVCPEDFEPRETESLVSEFLAATNVDEMLAEICVACLCNDPELRPANGTEVAKLVAAYQSRQAERLKQTEIERAEAETRAREVKKRARLRLIAVSAFALAGIIGIAAFSWYQNQVAENRRGLLSDFEVAKNRIEIFRDRGDFDTADQTLSSITQKAQEAGDPGLDHEIEILRQDNQIIRDLDMARHLRRSAEDPKKKWVFRKSGGDVGPYRDAIHAALGDIQNEEQQAVVARLNASAIKQHLIAGIDEWAVIEPDSEMASKLLGINIAADPDPIRSKIRDKQNWKNRELLMELAKSVDVATVDASTLLMLANNLHQLPEPEADRIRQTAFDFRYKNVATREALILLERALPFHQENFWMQMQIGYMMEYLELHWDASAHFMAATAVRADQPDALYRLARAKLAFNRFESANALSKRLIMLDPSAKHYIYDAMVREQHDRVVGREAVSAEASYRKAVEIEPKSATAKRELAIYFFKRRKYEQAVPFFQEAIELDRGDVVARYYFAKTLRAIRQFEDAESVLRPAVESEKDSFYEAFNEYGEVLLALEKFDDAKIYFTKAEETFFVRDPPTTLKTIQARIEQCSVLPRILETFLDDPDSVAVADAMKLGRFYLATGIQESRTERLYQKSLKHFSENQNLDGRDVLELAKYFSKKEVPEIQIANLHQYVVGEGSKAFLTRELKFNHYNAACVFLKAKTAGSSDVNWGKQAVEQLSASLDAIEKELKPFQPGSSAHDQAFNAAIRFLGHWRRDEDLAAIRANPDDLQEATAADVEQLWIRHGSVLAKLQKRMETGK